MRYNRKYCMTNPASLNRSPLFRRMSNLSCLKPWYSRILGWDLEESSGLELYTDKRGHIQRLKLSNIKYVFLKEISLDTTFGKWSNWNLIHSCFNLIKLMFPTFTTYVRFDEYYHSLWIILLIGAWMSNSRI